MWIKRFLICVSSLALAFLVLLIVLFFGGALELKDFLICLATLFSALGSLALGGVSIYNEKKATELTNELQSEKERNRVRPILRISINKINDEYKLKISNIFLFKQKIQLINFSF